MYEFPPLWPFKVTDSAFVEFRGLWTSKECETLALQHILCETPVSELAKLWVARNELFSGRFDGGKRVATITAIIHEVEKKVSVMKMEGKVT